MVRIRLARGGSKKRPFYSIVVADQRRAANKHFIERVGFFNPRATGGDERIRLDLQRVDYWVDNGAQPTDRVRQLMRQAATDAQASTEPAAAEPTAA